MFSAFQMRLNSFQPDKMSTCQNKSPRPKPRTFVGGGVMREPRVFSGGWGAVVLCLFRPFLKGGIRSFTFTHLKCENYGQRCGGPFVEVSKRQRCRFGSFRISNPFIAYPPLYRGLFNMICFQTLLLPTKHTIFP